MSSSSSSSIPPDSRLIDIVLDSSTIGRADADIEHERAVAIFDILERNFFWPVGHQFSDDSLLEYKLTLGIIDDRLVFTIHISSDDLIATHILSLTPFRQVIKDYFHICESYYEAIRSAAPSRIESIDMARRGLHNEGSEILRSRLSGKIELDLDTARRLFTLICALHRR